MKTIYTNKKTGNLCMYKGKTINTTNDNDGQIMVMYSRISDRKLFVKEEKEFFEEFE